MKFRLALLLVLAIALPSVAVSADTFDVPNSEVSVMVDGSISEAEWADAGHVQFTAVNGGEIDVMVKYDVAQASLVFGVTIHDASFDIYDRFFIYVDNGDDIESGPQPDDFLIGLSRDTEYSGNYKRDFDFYRVVGTGSGWDINNLLFDSRFLNAPFGKLDWARAETGDGWGFEMSMTLDRDPVHLLGLAFKQNDMDGGSSSLIYYPEDQPGATNYPTNWAHAIIQSYTPPIQAETVEDIAEIELQVPAISNEIPGYPIRSMLVGLCLIIVITPKYFIKSV
jgi:hypothetical protein